MNAYFKKAILSMMTIFLLTVVFTECTKEEATPVSPPTLKLEKQEIIIPQSGGEISMNFILENPVEGVKLMASSDAEWLKGFRIEESRIVFMADPNEALEQRSAEVKVVYGDAIEDSFKVLQNEKDAPILKLKKQEINIPQEGGEFSMGFTLENPLLGVEIKASSDAKWIHDFRIEESKIVFIVDENEEFEHRSAEVKVVYGKFFDGGFKVTQIGANAPTIEFEQEEIAIPEEGGEFSMSFTLNNPIDGVKLKASAMAPWISIIRVEESKIIFTVNINEAFDKRTGNVKVAYGDFINTSFTVSQSENTAPFRIDIPKEKMSLGSITTYVYPRDKEAEYVTFYVTQWVLDNLVPDGGKDDDSFFEFAMSNFSEFATTNYEYDLSTYLRKGDLLFKGDGLDFRYVGFALFNPFAGFFPGTNVYFVAMGVEEKSPTEFVRTTEIVWKKCFTPENYIDMSFDLKLELENDTKGTITVTPSRDDVYWTVGIVPMEDVTSSNMTVKEYVHRAWVGIEGFYFSFGLSPEDLITTTSYKGADAAVINLADSNLKLATEYVFFAQGLDEKEGMINTEVYELRFTTGGTAKAGEPCRTIAPFYNFRNLPETGHPENPLILGIK